MNLVLTSTVVPGVLLQDNTNVLNVKSVYSVMAVGDISRPKETQFLIR